MDIDVKELSHLTKDELAEKEKQLKQELFNFRFQMGTGRLENPMQIRKAKRDVARIKTIQRERQLAPAKQQGAQQS